MKKTLIFGVNGFSGLNLWNHLKSTGENDVVGTYHQLDPLKKRMLRGCSLIHCDITDYREIRNVLKKAMAQEIYFLPAQVTVAGAFKMAVPIYETNVLGAAKFFEALVSVGSKARILHVGSAEEYGKVAQDLLPIRESCPLAPVSPYGLSKVLQEKTAAYYLQNYRLCINMTRTFHFAGPMQPPSFVVSDFAAQIAQIELGLKRPVISVGNLEAKRDFTDIRDVVMAYQLIMNRAGGGEVFNVCSGYSVSIKTILNLLLAKTSHKITIIRDPKKIRKLDIPDFRGDNTRLIKKTGWRQKISLDQTLEETLQGWRQYFKKTKGR